MIVPEQRACLPSHAIGTITMWHIHISRCWVTCRPHSKYLVNHICEIAMNDFVVPISFSCLGGVTLPYSFSRWFRGLYTYANHSI